MHAPGRESLSAHQRASIPPPPAAAASSPMRPACTAYRAPMARTHSTRSATALASSRAGTASSPACCWSAGSGALRTSASAKRRKWRYRAWNSSLTSGTLCTTSCHAGQPLSLQQGGQVASPVLLSVVALAGHRQGWYRPRTLLVSPDRSHAHTRAPGHTTVVWLQLHAQGLLSACDPDPAPSMQGTGAMPDCGATTLRNACSALGHHQTRPTPHTRRAWGHFSEPPRASTLSAPSTRSRM